jgi:hypothetical protein
MLDGSRSGSPNEPTDVNLIDGAPLLADTDAVNRASDSLSGSVRGSEIARRRPFEQRAIRGEA